jgi:tRNA-splicing ligase RtcB
MNAVRLSLNSSDLPDNLKGLRSAVERDVPVGFNKHKRDVVPNSTVIALSGGLDRILEKFPGLIRKDKCQNNNWVRQIATLGGGNHFIELCLDENQDVWVMLHSGSRGIGNAIGRHFIEMARRDMEKIQMNLPDRDLAYFKEGTDNFNDYVEAVNWAQDYAMANRREMMRLVLNVLTKRLPRFTITKDAINCHHNYVSEEFHFGESVFVTRKGAIRAREGDLGIIPGSMGAKSFIVRGKGDPMSFCSCSHGAGRVMSRTKAKKMFSQEDLEAQTVGVECRKDKSVIDEIPAAYKDIDVVMENQSDLVEIVHTLKQVMCIKG